MFFNPKISINQSQKILGKWNIRFFAQNVLPNERIKLDSNGEPLMNGKNHVMEPVPESELPEGDWRRYPETTEWGIGWLPLGGYCKIAGMIDESMDKKKNNQFGNDFLSFQAACWSILYWRFLSIRLFSSPGVLNIPLENATNGLSFSQTMIDAGFRTSDKITAIDGKPLSSRMPSK